MPFRELERSIDYSVPLIMALRYPPWGADTITAAVWVLNFPMPRKTISVHLVQPSGNHAVRHMVRIVL